ncbi:Nnf1-domain-containing protein [Gigaspora margarita]|uniref:Nnf1-domain-containing protein n=1 Tax=Gigaspora margarita TaxID=4874 RepID=A0A8H4ARR8_GIGMA|nr:Nnf1-domain-containing protein [Gigaspora margarita]
MSQPQEGPRLRSFNQLLEKCLSETLNNFSYAKVAQCFPTLAREKPKRLNEAHGQVLTFLRSNVEEEFKLILKKRNIPEKLNELDALIVKARQREKDGQNSVRPTSTHNLNPKTIIRAKTIPLKEDEIKRLEGEFLKISKENEYLMSELRSKKEQSKCTILPVIEAITEINEVTKAATEIPVDEMHAIIETIFQGCDPQYGITT